MALVFIIFAYFKPKAAGVYIETNPVSKVYINGEERGTTPYKENLTPEEVVVELVATENTQEFEPLETKLRLVPGVETVIRHNFSSSADTSYTETISFEKIDSDTTSISIVTIPEGAKLLIDGRERAFSPYKTTSLSPGEHNIVLSENGFEDKVVKIRTHSGYNLTLVADLARNQEVVEESAPEPTPQFTAEARILPTGAGFLRVRSEPGLNGLELARVEPGEVYELVSLEPEQGWYQIEYSIGESGWVSGEYIELIGVEERDTNISTDSADTVN